MTTSTNKTIHVYGIANCDTVKKARAWLTEQGVDFEFHDFKKQGITADKLSAWIQAAGWEVLTNRKGTTWRKLDPTTQARVTDAASAAQILFMHNSIIKRPVVEWHNGHITVGFNADTWTHILSL